jgi:hypothetical protein
VRVLHRGDEIVGAVSLTHQSLTVAHFGLTSGREVILVGLDSGLGSFHNGAPSFGEGIHADHGVSMQR